MQVSCVCFLCFKTKRLEKIKLLYYSKVKEGGGAYNENRIEITIIWTGQGLFARI